MNTKLTLTLEQSIIEKEKSYTKGKGRGLSNIIETYLKAIAKENDEMKNVSTPIQCKRIHLFCPRNFAN